LAETFATKERAGEPKKAPEAAMVEADQARPTETGLRGWRGKTRTQISARQPCI
jgi:hypothetical protein